MKPLPTNPNIENYKNIAKALLKAWQRELPLEIPWEGSPVTISREHLLERIGTLRPRTPGDAGAIRLGDVQFLIAREYGFKTWSDFGTLDHMNSLVRGQKLPIFSDGGLPHDRMAAEIAKNARLPKGAEGEFAIVFAGIGLPHDSAEFFRSKLEEGGALERTASSSTSLRTPAPSGLLTPRFALTAAEYLAFVEGKHVLAILTDMTNYCEALREVSSSKGEIPSRKGFPGYLYSDLATLFERAGCLRGAKGTLTQLSILTMPADG